MNRRELVAQLAEKTDFSQKDVDRVLRSFCEIIVDTLKKGENIRLIGFGTFTTKRNTARTGKNPRTGEEIIIPASVTPMFKAGKGFKEKINTK